MKEAGVSHADAATAAHTSVSPTELIEFLECPEGSVAANWEGDVTGPVSLLRPGREDGFAFCDLDGLDALSVIEASPVRVLFVTTGTLAQCPQGIAGRTLIGCASPRLAFVRAVDRFWPEDPVDEFGQGAGIHPSAEVASSARIAAGVVIGPGCRIEAQSAIHGGVHLYRGVRIGRQARIDANAVIGGPGFGFVREPGAGWRRFPQRGAVVLGDRVEVGAGACIDRGALDDTVIGSGTKIDNLAYVAHNVVVGRDCLIMASTILAGSCRLEDDVVISPGAMVRDHCTVGKGAHIGMGAVVVADVPPGSVVAGVPAAPIRDRMKRN